MAPRKRKSDILTLAQRNELRRLSLEPQPNFGTYRVRVQNGLVKKGLARIEEGKDCDLCLITEAGLRAMGIYTMPEDAR